MENQGIGSWIHRRRVKSAGRLAVVDGDRRRDYGELAARIDRLASALADRGIAPGDRVGFLGANSIEFLETLFAAGTLGAVFVPLNLRLAPAEIAYQLDDAGVGILVHDVELEHLVTTPVRRIAIGEGVSAAAGVERYEDVLDSGVAEHREVVVALDDPAAILYTSGTTGKPKGAVLSHGALTWNTYNVLVDYDVASDDIALMVSPLFHVASLGMGALPTLLKGGALVLQRRFDPAEALAAIQEHGVTSLSGVPTTFQMMAEHPDWGSTDLSSLRKLTCGGSAVPARVVDAWEERGLAFSWGYGMTEASPGVTALPARYSREMASTAGLPHFFTDVRIVGDDGAPAASGEIGEIEVRGPNLLSEYHGLPHATAEAFHDGWFRTGDLGRRDERGFLTIADRSKDMIISGGENIYPAEVEAVLLELDEIAAVAIIGVPDERWGEVGRAIVVAADGATVDHELVAGHLDGRVARYKVPKSTVVVDDVPRTASGKIRKPLLRERYGAP